MWGRMGLAALAAATTMVGALAAPAWAAPQLAGLTADGALLRFDAAAPSQTTRVAITGLQAGDRLAAIDVHGTTGQLLGITRDGQWRYVIDPQTGAAGGRTQNETYFMQAPPALGFDIGRFPFVRPGAPTVGMVVSGDRILRWGFEEPNGSGSFKTGYVAGDPAAGTAPALSALAVDPPGPPPPGQGVAHYALDSARDTLVRFEHAPGEGFFGLRTVGPLGVDVPDAQGFDVAGGTGYLAMGGPLATVTRPALPGLGRPDRRQPVVTAPAGGLLNRPSVAALLRASTLYRVELGTGKATRVGRISTSLSGGEVIGLAALGSPAP